MKVGYARVSSLDQNIDSQIEKLKECDKIFYEKKSGVDSEREKLRECLDFVREGDILIVTRLDRLARSCLHLGKIIDQLEKKKVNLHVIDQQIDTTTPSGRLLFHTLAAMAQFENEVRKERQMDGILSAKKRGVRFGKKKAISPQEILSLRKMRKEGYLIREIGERFKLKKSTIYKYLKESDARQLL